MYLQQNYERYDWRCDEEQLKEHAEKRENNVSIGPISKSCDVFA